MQSIAPKEGDKIFIMKTFSYQGAKTKEISFPLGGIGSGCIGLAGNGQLIDWEIFNKPNKFGRNGFSHFAIKAERDKKVLDARVLQGDVTGPRSGNGNANFGGLGFGVNRETMAGLPHFRKVSFEGEFPFAALTFQEPAFPGRVQMTAFNPFIPLNDADSSIPAAFFSFDVTNTSKKPIDYTVALTTRNPQDKANVNRAMKSGGITLLHQEGTALPADDVKFGDICIGTNSPDSSHQEYWFRGGWFDNLGIWWRNFTSPGPLKNRSYPESSGGNDHASLAARITVPAGKTGTIRFVLAWNYPNQTNYWNPEKKECCGEGCACKPATWRNYYATLFKDSAATVRYCLKNWTRLYSETLRFKETLFASTIPAPVLDAVSANISILKTPTVMRLEDGSLYGFEGCHCGAGCCEGSCQHVWNYAYALPFLFPKLERSMRELEYRYSLGDDGSLAFRLQLPIGRARSAFRPCADGQFGTVMKMYREWKISGDTAWLKKWWPSVKKTIEYAWAPTNADRWDPEKTGVLWGRQHHTLDVELFGPNSWLTGFYLGALKAGAEMADACGDPEAAAEYRRIFAKGKEWTDRHLFNGEYYHQEVKLKDRAQLEQFSTKGPDGKYAAGEAYNAYWNNEHKELKYQILEGSGIDQVLAQWHANLIGLGEIFDPKQTRSALRAIYKYNYKPSMRDYANFCRVFCLEDEAGTVMFDWPAGKYKPMIPMTYAEETMHGFEYQVAVHMIQEGMLKEGLDVVKGVRDRYDGETRNPWNEIECGSNYARSMASYSLLNAFSGFSFNMVNRQIGFNPVHAVNGKFRCFWSLDSAWGDITITPQGAVLQVLHGKLELKSMALSFADKNSTVSASINGRRVACKRIKDIIDFGTVIAIPAGSSLRIKGKLKKR